MNRVLGSVRARASAGATLVVALALVAAATALLLVLRSNLHKQAELEAEVKARDVASQIATGTAYDKLDLPDGEDHPVVVVGGNGRVLAAGDDVRAIDGKPVGAVGKPAGTPPGPSDDDDDDDDETRLRPGEVDDEVHHRDGTATVDGKEADYRFASVEAKDTRGAKATVQAGAALAPQQDAVATVRDAMLIGLPLLLLVVAGVTWLVTRRALRPVEGIRSEMAAITASTDLSRRVPVPSSQDEIGRLARTTNETLAALETSVERQRRFVADASHELRSPIASLRTQLEVAAAHPELLDVPGAVEDTVRLQRLAADLLLLARLDAGERPSDTRIDLAALVREETSQRVTDRIPVRVGPLTSGEVAGSRSQLARVLGNLLDNAQRHAEASVRVEVVRDGAWAVLRVDDDGPGVPEADRERIFERFVRLDDARARDDGGAGLGLAIARDVAMRHGGSLAVREGSVFELRLPLAGG
ncbi:sensor histidine kinase [Streptomyces halobius]|uniref:histidine kinase n=1 Tax=Streptomyces halobius TaxID=2879846 RepID=A0ABY4M5K4_9ACTN|nr:HAMP domain-containing sensor histidine kinase [Streptomyces halobius]UQA93051.1 HAMP domain-containing histidine kinase [Streptomyces halobius]